MRVKAVIQSYAHARVVFGELQNFLVLSPRHSDLGDVRGVESVLAQDRRCARSRTLVEQDPPPSKVVGISSSCVARRTDSLTRLSRSQTGPRPAHPSTEPRTKESGDSRGPSAP